MSLPRQDDTNSVFTHSPHDDSDYIGQATVTVRGIDIPVELELKGYSEPIDGVFRWIGRIRPNEQLTAIVGDEARVKATIRTTHSARDAFIGDPDPWNRYRVIGKSTPPFHVPTDLSEVEAE
ncbi:monooxygenase [Mycobacteroides abscessus subsp. bolletii]|uniref:DUF4873 domain-containing protein n=1 Tax=Mycobacteroides abscessus TaxID=36809 RepID=UPI0009A8C8D1|nr:DUF4873 domain-containing protein [Mycobacteroides abscessus]MBN7302129.1 DUF4873 domain-containing protein [Mycobacteroides abscessus subsp. bolletii]MDO3130117.1 DUF4873 domain-containing protein [Mycobacteroides abscessus subsp. bolletii]SKF67175.1 monooxygenase [Mycobacteroides abscessus subsp. bolletii]SKF70955.1 monooxygenase [Mycobacteroides abscessus subsp. bolletii]SPX86591.1 flavin binding monooxygenase [Mycobacteroides abscessus]